MSNVLLVDTNVSASPIYKYLRKSGHNVYVIGANPNDFLAKCAENYVQFDYSDVTGLGIIINELKIDYLIPGCNDLSYKACAAVNVASRFPGIESLENNEIINNKESFRNFAEENRLPVPKVYLESDIENIKFPVIIKPVDAYSGRGITIVKNKCQHLLSTAIKSARNESRTGRYIVEEYVTGQLYSHSAFISEYNIICDVVVEESCTANPFAVDTSHVMPYVSDGIMSILRNSTRKIAQTLRLRDGLIHTQFIQNNDAVWLIESTRRCPGDLYSRLIELTTDLNYSENYTRPFLNLPLKFTGDSSVKNFVMRHTITDTLGGKFESLRFNEEISILEYVSLSLSGDAIKSAPNGRIGILFATTDSQDDFKKLYNNAVNRRLYELRMI